MILTLSSSVLPHSSHNPIILTTAPVYQSVPIPTNWGEFVSLIGNFLFPLVNTAALIANYDYVFKTLSFFVKFNAWILGKFDTYNYAVKVFKYCGWVTEGNKMKSGSAYI